MRTEDSSYSDYLQAKYLPGRRLYLRTIFYPKLMQAFKGGGAILDLGCGSGEFLAYCQSRGRRVLGVDSNPQFAKACQDKGFTVLLDDICELKSVGDEKFRFAVCDNVLEHLEQPEIEKFFRRVEEVIAPGGKLICIVPGVKGYQKDPTHRTFVNRPLAEKMSHARPLKLASCYYHPFNMRRIDEVLYLNMQVFEFEKAARN
jgi:SAM-dependent methyltransferase